MEITSFYLLIVLVILAVGILLLEIRPRAKPDAADQKQAMDELLRLRDQVGQLELRFTQALLEQIGGIKAKFAESLGQTMNDTTNLVRSSLDSLSKSVQDQMDAAGQRIAGTDTNLQNRFDELRKQVQATITDTSKAVEAKLGDTTKQLDDRMATTTTALDSRLAELSKQLSELKSGTDKMVDIGTDIKTLQDVLSPPKLRGTFGEALLENLLNDVLPQDRWQRQYAFGDGSIVDAIIKLPGGFVPVDSKFPVDSFTRIVKAEDEKARQDAQKQFARDVRLKIDETSTYIKPAEGTFDFALMFIPGENVYYELLANPAITAKDDVLSYARSKRVVPVSPQVFYAYLQTILLGLRGMKVEENARQIIDKLATLRNELVRVNDSYSRATNQLRHASTNLEEVGREIGKLDSLISQLESLGSGENKTE